MIVISFVNMKGGVGKTTLAVNVADFLAKRHSKKCYLLTWIHNLTPHNV